MNGMEEERGWTVYSWRKSRPIFVGCGNEFATRFYRLPSYLLGVLAFLVEAIVPESEGLFCVRSKKSEPAH